MRRCWLFVCAAVVLCLLSADRSWSEGQVGGSALMVVDNKYRNSSPLQLEEIIFGLNAADRDLSKLPEIGCHFDVSIRWIAEIGSRGYGTPLVDDVFGEERQIVVAGLENFVEILYGSDGDKAKNWPFSLTSNMLASPLLYDVDGDGVDELLITTQDAEFVFLRTDALQVVAGRTLKVPPVSVHRDWYVDAAGSVDGGESPAVAQRQRQAADSDEQKTKNKKARNKAARKPLATRAPGDDDDDDVNAKDLLRDTKPGLGDFQGWLTDEGLESFELFLPTSTSGEYIKQLREAVDPLFSVQYNQWLAEHGAASRGDYLWVDAHVLSTPVIADLDGDGAEELVVGVSYYFDPAKFADAEQLKSLGANVNIAHYLLCGVAVFDLRGGQLKWTIELDRTTEYTPYRATLSGSPVVADLDGDGRLEIVVGTGVGWLYIVSADGKLWRPASSSSSSQKAPWPQLVDAIYSSPSVVDLDGDGHLDILACDSNGNVVAFNVADGEVIWDAHMSGYPVRPASFADVDGDGALDVVVGTLTGQIWAWAGSDGQLLANFPVKLAGRVLGQPLLIPWPGKQTRTNHAILVHASDGVLYLIDGATGCADKVDLGSSSTAMLLADDVTGRGWLELLLVTDNRKVTLLETDVRYDPRRAWRWEDPSGGGLGAALAPLNQLVVVVQRPREAPGASAVREIVGAEFRVVFEIADGRILSEAAGQQRDEYRVRIMWGTRQLLAEQTFSRPGVYAIDVPTPQEFRSSAKITVQVQSKKTGATSRDSFWISINVGFYRTLKWALLLPLFVLCSVAFYLAANQRASSSSSSL